MDIHLHLRLSLATHIAMYQRHQSQKDSPHGTTRSYIIGYGLSLLLTFIAFSFVVEHEYLGHKILYSLIFTLALIQLFVQVSYFLHLNKESSPRWNLAV